MSLIAGNLAVVQKLLDGAQLNWGVHGGAAAHLYGNRRPIQDIDIVVQQGMLGQVSTLLQKGQKAVQFDGGRILWRGIIMTDDLTVRQNGAVYPFILDASMIAHLQRKPLLGSKILLLSPEDVLVYKLLLYRTENQGKFDVPDAEGIIKRQPLDLDYVRERMEASGTTTIVTPRLAEHGIVL